MAWHVEEPAASGEKCDPRRINVRNRGERRERRERRQTK
jgi:hypothetical protein